MKTKLLTLFTFLMISHQCSVNASSVQDWGEMEWISQTPVYSFDNGYNYFSFGVGPLMITPTVGVGLRQHYQYHGFDASLNFTTAGEAHQIQGDLVYHFVTNPYRKDPWYLGAGVATSVFVTNHGDTAYGIAPDFVVGKELKNRNFIEFHVQAPTWLSDSASMSSTFQMNIPLTYVKYGIGF